MHVWDELQKTADPQGAPGAQRSSGTHRSPRGLHLPFFLPALMKQRHWGPPFALHLASVLHLPLQAATRVEAADVRTGARYTAPAAAAARLNKA
jgi:hypothetical protein